MNLNDYMWLVAAVRDHRAYTISYMRRSHSFRINACQPYPCGITEASLKAQLREVSLKDTWINFSGGCSLSSRKALRSVQEEALFSPLTQCQSQVLAFSLTEQTSQKISSFQPSPGLQLTIWCGGSGWRAGVHLDPRPCLWIPSAIKNSFLPHFSFSAREGLQCFGNLNTDPVSVAVVFILSASEL